MSAVYLLHFDPPYKQAKHYLGFAEEDVNQRIERHRKGKGANLTKVAVDAGCELVHVATWEGEAVDRHFERKLKNGKNAPKLCPICSPESGWGKNFEGVVHTTVTTNTSMEVSE